MKKQFPIQASHFKNEEASFIPWWLAEIAYEGYNCKEIQSLEAIAKRGGFGREELIMLIRKEYGRVKTDI